MSGMGFEIDLPVPKAEDFRKCIACDLCDEHIAKLMEAVHSMNRLAAALERQEARAQAQREEAVLGTAGESSCGDMDI